MRKRWGLILLAVVALAGCSRSPAPTPTPIATAPPSASAPRSKGGAVVASGEVVPTQETQLSFALTGRVQTVAVVEGEEVQTGEVLVALDTTDLEHAVAQAEATLEAAEAQLAQVKAGAREEEIEGAEEAAAVAEANLASAQADLASAQANLDKLLAGATERELEIARRRVDLAKNALWGAQGQRDAIAGSSLSKPGDKDAAQAAVGVAYEEKCIAQLEYEDLQAGAREEDIAIARAQVDGARARVDATRAQFEQAKAQLELLRAGASEEAIAVAQARVEEAQTALNRARAALDDTKLTAPFAGTVTALEVGSGETVLPEQTVLTLADLRRLQVETTDLSERDVDKVAIGQQTIVYVEALGLDIEGRVVRIASQATTVGGDVVYEVVIELDEQPSGLRWGMSVEVEITTR